MPTKPSRFVTGGTSFGGTCNGNGEGTGPAPRRNFVAGATKSCGTFGGNAEPPECSGPLTLNWPSGRATLCGAERVRVHMRQFVATRTARWNLARRLSLWSAVAKPAELPLYHGRGLGSEIRVTPPHAPGDGKAVSWLAWLPALHTARGRPTNSTVPTSQLSVGLPSPLPLTPYLPSLSGCSFDADQLGPRSFASLGGAGTAQRSIPTGGREAES
jgi:hypothetical protein